MKTTTPTNITTSILFHPTLLLFSLLLLYPPNHLAAQTTLEKGDIAIVGFEAADEEFAFVTLVDLDSGTHIYFTDEEADDDFTIGTGEGTVRYTAPAGGLSAGTVVIGATHPIRRLLFHIRRQSDIWQ